MQTSDLHLLLTVARLGSFAAAARARHLDPSSVSRSIAGLEADLGFRLFQRSTRRLALTEAGAAYCSRIEPLLEELEAAGEQSALESKTPSGRLRLTASVAFGEQCLVPLLPAFRCAFPEIGLDLVLTDRQLDLLAESIDLAIRHGAALKGDAITVKLRPTRYCVCASPKYLTQYGRPQKPRDLGEHSCLRIDLPFFRESWRFRDPDGKEETISVRGPLLISSALSLKSATLAGLGPALLADWLADQELANGRLIDLFPQHRATAGDFDTALWLIYPSRRYLPARVRLTIDFLRKRIGDAAQISRLGSVPQ